MHRIAATPNVQAVLMKSDGLIPGFCDLKRIDAAAIAAAVSPASSDPGADVVIAQAGRDIFMSSGRPQ